MRIKIDLEAINGNIVPYNYHYPLSAAIYNLLRFSSEEYAEFLHNSGYKLEKRNFKLFTAGLKMKSRPYGQKGHLLLSPKATLIVSSPIINEFIEHFLTGTFYTKTIVLKLNSLQITFAINGFDVEENINFTNTCNFYLVSPMVLSKPSKEPGKPSHYILPTEVEDAENALNINLLHKYQVLFQPNYTSEGIKLHFDEAYLQRKKRCTMLIKIKQDTPEETSIRGIMCPFRLEGDPNLIKVGYDCGFGINNSMGFGLAEIVN